MMIPLMTFLSVSVLSSSPICWQCSIQPISNDQFYRQMQDCKRRFRNLTFEAVEFKYSTKLPAFKYHVKQTIEHIELHEYYDVAIVLPPHVWDSFMDMQQFNRSQHILMITSMRRPTSLRKRENGVNLQGMSAFFLGQHKGIIHTRSLE